MDRRNEAMGDAHMRVAYKPQLVTAISVVNPEASLSN